MTWIVAFDVGICNLAWCMVEWKDPPAAFGHVQEEDHVGGNMIRREEWIRHHLRIQGMDLWNSQTEHPRHTYHPSVLFAYLTKWDHVWQKVHVVLIEKQLVTPRHLNVQAFKMSQHLLSFFVWKYPSLCVMEYPAVFKSKLLFGRSFPTGYARKRWAIEKAKEFLERDPVALAWFLCFPKEDDLSDALLMTIVYIHSHLLRGSK